MKISTKGRYALEAVVDLAVYSNNGLESLKNIADRLDISKNYLEQLFVGFSTLVNDTNCIELSI